MKALLICAYTPTPHNQGGPSALPYYLAKHRLKSIQLDLYCYNDSPGIDQSTQTDLNKVFNNITIVSPLPSWKYYPLRLFREISQLSSLSGSLRQFPGRRDLQAIRKEKYDLIWIYPNILFQWYHKLRMYKTVMTGPDNSFLNYTLIKEKYIDAGINIPDIPQIQKFNKFYRDSHMLEKKWASSGALLHVVGNDDKLMYDKLGAADHSFFSPHPHYFYENRKTSLLSEGKLTILFSGTAQSIYTGNFNEAIIEAMATDATLANSFKVLFIGKNFENYNNRLKYAGYETTHTPWVPNYEAAISTAHIQIFPIILGTGTKGKVLCALATGLLCIGTKHAFENIKIELNSDCLFIPDNDAGKVLNSLHEIVKNKETYEKMAERASQKVRQMHAPELTAELFWNKVIDYWKL